MYNWLLERIDSDPVKVEKASVSIGPKGGYFARVGSSHISYALPADLETSIKESDSPPATVALGIKGAWVAIFEDGSREWNLRDAYSDLANGGKLVDKTNRPVFVALNPYRENSYFMVSENGQCSYSTSFHDDKEGQHLHEST